MQYITVYTLSSQPGNYGEICNISIHLILLTPLVLNALGLPLPLIVFFKGKAKTKQNEQAKSERKQNLTKVVPSRGQCRSLKKWFPFLTGEWLGSAAVQMQATVWAQSLLGQRAECEQIRWCSHLSRGFTRALNCCPCVWTIHPASCCSLNLCSRMKSEVRLTRPWPGIQPQLVMSEKNKRFVIVRHWDLGLSFTVGKAI